jgi:hypothetical protein
MLCNLFLYFLLLKSHKLNIHTYVHYIHTYTHTHTLSSSYLFRDTLSCSN